MACGRVAAAAPRYRPRRVRLLCLRPTRPLAAARRRRSVARSVPPRCKSYRWDVIAARGRTEARRQQRYAQCACAHFAGVACRRCLQGLPAGVAATRVIQYQAAWCECAAACSVYMKSYPLVFLVVTAEHYRKRLLLRGLH